MKKLAKVLLYIILFVGVLFVVIYFGSEPIIKKIVSEKLEKERIAGIYKASFKSAYLNIFQMGISITGFELKPDSSAECKKLFQHQKHLAHIKIGRLNINELDILALINDNKINVNKVVIKSPEIKLYKNHHFTKALKKNKSNNTKSDLEDIQLKSIIVNNLVFNYFLDEDKIADILIGDLDLKLINPIVEVSLLNKPLDAISIDDIKLSAKKISFAGNKEFYNASINSLDYNYKTNVITLSKIKVKPRYNKSKFAKKHKYQCDRIDASVAKVEVKGLDIIRLIKNKILAIKEVNIKSLNIEIFRDKNFPFNLNKYPKLPQQALRESKQKMEIENINVLSSTIVYLEKAKGAKKTGKVEFKNVHIGIHNLGNTSAWQNNRNMIVNGEIMVFGKGQLKIDFDFPLKSNTFYINGQLGKFPMTLVNSISIPNAGIKIRSGQIKKMDFKASLNRTNSTGKLNLYYQDLDISILKKKEKSGLRKDSKLLNVVANTIIPTQNPNKKGQFYEATIAFERDKNKGVLAYVWKTIFSGLKDSIKKGHKKDQKKESKKETKESDKKENKKKSKWWKR